MQKGIYINPTTFIPVKQLSQSLTAEIATRQFALGSYTSFFNWLPDPDPLLRRLGADQSIYKDLLADDQVGSLFNRRKNLTKSLDWLIEQGNAGDAEVQLCERALTILEANGCKVKDIIDQTLNPIGFGYSVFEINWQPFPSSLSLVRRGTQGEVWLPVTAWEKPREWFYFDSKNQLHFRNITNAEGIIVLGLEADPKVAAKFILLQNQPTYENPYGDKALSRCFWPVTFKRGGMKFYSTFVEKYGMPYLFGKLPRGAKSEEHADLLEKLNNMIQDAVGTGPDDSSLQILEVAGQSADLYEKYLQRCDNSISKALLLNALSTDIQHTGARAASETGATTIEGDIGQTDRDFPVAFFNELFKRIIDLNLGTGLYPTFEVNEIEDSNKDFAERDKIITEAFSTAGQKIKRTKEFLINNYGYDENEFELEETQTPQPYVAPSPLIKGRGGVGLLTPPADDEPVQLSGWTKFWNRLFGKNVEFADATPLTLADQLTDALPDKFLQFQMEEGLQPVIELAKKSKSRNEFINLLAAQFPKMNSKQIEDLAAKVFFIAEIKGQLSAK
jgi:phage gp29-like protein